MKKTVIIGNIGQDAQLRTTEQGKNFASFTVAVSEKIGQQQITTWFSCSGWGERFTGNLLQYLKKGTKVYIEGNYSPRLFQRQDGSMDISHDLMVNHVELLSSVQQTQQPVQQPVQQPAQQQGQWGSPGVSTQNPGPSAPYGAPVHQQPVHQQPIQQPAQQYAAPGPQLTPGSGHKDDNGMFPNDPPF